MCTVTQNFSSESWRFFTQRVQEASRSWGAYPLLFLSAWATWPTSSKNAPRQLPPQGNGASRNGGGAVWSASRSRSIYRRALVTRCGPPARFRRGRKMVLKTWHAPLNGCCATWVTRLRMASKFREHGGGNRKRNIAAMFPLLRQAKLTQRTRDFVALARLWAEAKGGPFPLASIQEGRRYNAQVERILEKAQPGSALTGVGSPDNWGSELVDYASVAEGFAASLRHVGVFDRMLPSDAHCAAENKTGGHSRQDRRHRDRRGRAENDGRPCRQARRAAQPYHRHQFADRACHRRRVNRQSDRRLRPPDIEQGRMARLAGGNHCAVRGALSERP